MRLSATQKEIVEYIESCKRSPTYGEIAEGVGIAIRAVQYQLDRLEEAKVIKRSKASTGRVIPRTIEVLSHD